MGKKINKKEMSVLFLLGFVAVAGIHMQKGTVNGNGNDCCLGVEWRLSIAVRFSIFISTPFCLWLLCKSEAQTL